MGLERRVALVSGGGRGIGRAISLALAADGADVAVNYHRDEQAAVDTVAAITALGQRAVAYRASVTSLPDLDVMMRSVLDDFGPVDLLVNNAGVMSRGRFVVDTDPEEPERLLATHALGSHHLCRLVVPGMRKVARGDIIFISSRATAALVPGAAPYAMAKAAMEALALTLAKEEAANGIRVNIVAPGLADTEMGRRIVRAGGSEDMSAVGATMPFGRVCQPDDVASVVRFLVSDAGSHITGQRICIDGGQGWK